MIPATGRTLEPLNRRAEVQRNRKPLYFALGEIFGTITRAPAGAARLCGRSANRSAHCGKPIRRPAAPHTLRAERYGRIS